MALRQDDAATASPTLVPASSNSAARHAKGSKVLALDSLVTDSDAEPDRSDGNDTAPLLGAKTSDTAPDDKLSDSAANHTSDADATMVPVHRPSRARRVRALGYVIFAAFNFSIMSACVKYACRFVSPHEVGLWRTILACAFNYVCVRVKKIDLRVDVAHRNLLHFGVVLVFIWDTTILGERVSGYSVFGGLVIVAGAVAIGVRRARARR